MKYTQKQILFQQATQVNEQYYRYYQTPDGGKLPSITTILSKTKSERDKKSLDYWKQKEGDAAHHITELSKIYGTKTHKAIEDTLNNKIPDLNSEMVGFHYNQLFPYIQNINNIAGIELALYSEKMNVAGTTDCIAEYHGILSVMDYKTKRKPQKEQYMTDYFIQATAYAKMFEELTKVKVPQIVVLVSEEHGTTQEFVKDPNNYVSLLQERLSHYQELIG